MRFRHQITVPKQDLPVYAKDRLEKAEDENAKLREQVARFQRQRQDQETFYEKRMAEQKTELERVQERKLAEQQKAISKQHEEQKLELQRAQERKLAEQQRAAVLKQHEEQIRSERARAEEEAVATLKKQIQDLQKKTYELGKRLPEIEGQGKNTGEAGGLISELGKASQDLRRERDRAKGSSPFPPPPDPLHPVSSLRELRRWLFRHEGEDLG
jgi:chromosome segregation ATPase